MSKYTIAEILSFIVNLVFGFIVLGLLIRFILRLLGANPEAGFSAFIYNSTNPLLDPFRGIFTPYTSGGNVIEFSTLVAILVYLFIAWILNEFIASIAYNATVTYRKPREVI